MSEIKSDQKYRYNNIILHIAASDYIKEQAVVWWYDLNNNIHCCVYHFGFFDCCTLIYCPFKSRSK